MMVDCHTHLWECPGHLSDEFVAEANARSRGKPMDLHVPPERHWPAMRNVDKAIVFGIRAFHSGLSSPNEYIADYARAHPEKIIGFAAVDPTHDNVRETLEHALDDLKLRGVKLGPIPGCTFRLIVMSWPVSPARLASSSRECASSSHRI